MSHQAQTKQAQATPARITPRALLAASSKAALALAVALAGAPAPVDAKPQEAAPAPAPEGETLRVLILSGANNHDWEWTSPSLERLLEATGRIEADITYAPATDLANPDRLSAYDAVVLDYNGPRWGEPAESHFLTAVQKGLGVTVVHAANNAFPGWEAYESLVCHCWRKGTGHGRFHAFDVQVDDREHPITRTLPNLVQHPDELYHRLVHMHDCGFEQLAGAYSDPATGGTGETEPMIVVRREGEGRIFHTPLGHVWKGGTRAAHEDPQFGELLRRGTEWAATGEVDDGSAGANRLTPEQERAGWELLFNGRDLAGWRGRGEAGPGPGWRVESGCIRRVGAAGDLLTTSRYQDFELEFEFMVAAGTNSGVKYRVQEPAVLGPEYQVLDDPRHPSETDHHRVAALYDLLPAQDAPYAGAARWNRGRIVARGGHLEHWLNGVRVVSTDLESEVFQAAHAASKFKGNEGFAQPAPGPILLQDHGGEVWYRSLRIRSFDALEARRVALLEDEGLGGWIPTGDAIWERQGDTVIGRVGGGGQSFLRTAEEYGDFLFEVDVWLEVKGNSGIQFRSQVVNGRRVCGYQAEIDPSPRRWSGGIYQECSKWLDDLKEDPLAQSAFRLDDWNTYRIECVGDHLRVWVNGIPTADLVDGQAARGVFAFQVHSGQQGVIHWRNPRLWSHER